MSKLKKSGQGQPPIPAFPGRSRWRERRPPLTIPSPATLRQPRQPETTASSTWKSRWERRLRPLRRMMTGPGNGSRRCCKLRAHSVLAFAAPPCSGSCHHTPARMPGPPGRNGCSGPRSRLSESARAGSQGFGIPADNFPGVSVGRIMPRLATGNLKEPKLSLASGNGPGCRRTA